MGMLSSLLHPSRPYKKAGEQLQKYHGEAQQQLMPYQQQGQAAYEPLNNAMQSLLNPMQLQNEWMQGYETSPYARMMQNRSIEQGLNAAGSMGLAGSTPALRAIQGQASAIGSEDQMRYMDQLMQKYMSGAQLAQGLYGTGANAAGQGAQQSMHMGENMGKIAWGQQAAPGEMLGRMLGFEPSNNNPWSTTGGNNNQGQSGGQGNMLTKLMQLLPMLGIM